jgi:hypothetical protein
MDKKLHQMIKGSIRKQHFESGGSVGSWRGVANVYVDKPKKRNKYKCRKKVEHEKEEL